MSALPRSAKNTIFQDPHGVTGRPIAGDLLENACRADKAHFLVELLDQGFNPAEHGAKWRPTERYQINDARRSLLKMSVDYTVEFVWIMAKYDCCSRDTIEQLLRTPTIRRHVVKHQPRIQELIKEFPSTPDVTS